ncbi:MAG: DUF1351 domain-containing protein [Coprobacillus sp.]
MAEFKIIASSKKGDLSVNFDELKTQLETEIKKYDYEVTEDLIAQAKIDKARINNLATKIDDKRKEKKSEYCEPLVKFEEKMNMLRDIAKNGYKKINDQIIAFDEKEKEEKQIAIAEYYISKNFDLVPLNKIFDPKWLNKTCKDWDKQIDNIIDKVNEELKLIDSFGLSQIEKQEVKGYYLDCLNITQARTQFDAQKERREALLKRQEEIKQQQPSNVQEMPSTEPLQEEAVKEVQEVKKERIVVEFVATREFLDDMNVAIKTHKPQVRILEREDV